MFIPAHNNTIKPIVIDYKTYVPVKLPTDQHTITKTITPTT